MTTFICKAMKCLILIFAVLLTIQTNCYARRMPPKEVKPLEYKSLKIIVVPSLSKYFSKTNSYGAYIEVWDNNTNKLLWWLQIYEIKYKSDLERDVQDVYIKHMEIKDDEVVLTNEIGMIFSVNLNTKEVAVNKNSIKPKDQQLVTIIESGKWGPGN